MPELTQLLSAVLQFPDEDTPRLMYADALDERGEPGDAERAAQRDQPIADIARHRPGGGAALGVDGARCDRIGGDVVLGELDRRVAYVRRDGPEDFTTVSNVCMHLGCPVQFKTTGFACPCHGGQYDTEGIRTAGPPIRPLNRYEYKVENGTLFVGRAFATEEVDGAVVMTDQFKLPGEPVGGLLGWLYPVPSN